MIDTDKEPYSPRIFFTDKPKVKREIVALLVAIFIIPFIILSFLEYQEYMEVK